MLKKIICWFTGHKYYMSWVGANSIEHYGDCLRCGAKNERH